MSKRNRKRRTYFPIDSIVGGLKLDVPPQTINPANCPDCKNVMFLDGIVRQSYGAGFYAGTKAAALSGTIMLLPYVVDELICHTTSKFYNYNTGTEVFDLITTSAPAALTFTGDIDDAWSWGILNDLYVYSNGLDQIRMWTPGAGTSDALTNVTNYRAKWLNIYGGRLCMYNVKDGATWNPQNIRWSVVGDPTDITGAGSGYQDLGEVLKTSDDIMRAEKSGDYAVIYAENCIATQQYTGEVDTPFAFILNIPDAGLAARRALASVDRGARHIFLAEDNIYAYTCCGFGLDPIGDPVKADLFSEINRTYMSRSFAVHYPAREIVRFHIPTGDSAVPDTYYELNIKDNTWARGERAFTGAGYRTDSPILLYGDASGYVYEDSSDYDNVGSVYYMDAWWETKDFTVGERNTSSFVRWMEIRFQGQGDTVTVYYSVDEGSTWTSVKAVTLASAWDTYKADLDVVSQKIRFRFRNQANDETFAMRWLEVGFLDVGEVRT